MHLRDGVREFRMVLCFGFFRKSRRRNNIHSSWAFATGSFAIRTRSNRSSSRPGGVSHADQVQVRVHRDRVRPVHVADHVRTAGGQLLQSKYTESRFRSERVCRLFFFLLKKFSILVDSQKTRLKPPSASRSCHYGRT